MKRKPNSTKTMSTYTYTAIRNAILPSSEEKSRYKHTFFSSKAVVVGGLAIKEVEDSSSDSLKTDI